MSDIGNKKLLTHAGIQANSGVLNLPCSSFIDGRFQPAKPKKRLVPINPASGKPVGDIRAGTVAVKLYGEGDITTLSGGYRHAGFGGRDNSLHAHDQYTELKTIWIDLNDRNQTDSIN